MGDRAPALQLGEVFWHLYEYPTRAAAEAAKPRSFGTVAESLGKVWLYVIAGKEWRPAAGQRVAVIGPLRVKPAAQYTARYMEAVFPPGMQTAVHTHSGPEAWYILSGELRRSVVLVLHDIREPCMTVTTDWKPAKPCVL